jgi:hypothetical protein
MLIWNIENYIWGLIIYVARLHEIYLKEGKMYAAFSSGIRGGAVG